MAAPYDTQDELGGAGVASVTYPDPLPESHTTAEIRVFQNHTDLVIEAMKAYNECPCGQHMDIAMHLVHQLAGGVRNPAEHGTVVKITLPQETITTK